MGAPAPIRRWAGLMLAVAVTLSALPTSAAHAAEGTIRNAGSPAAVPGSYIVVLRDRSAPSALTALTGRYGGTVRHVYTATIQGYAAAMSERQARRLAADPRVAYVAQDQRVHALDVQPSPPSWGLDRVDQRHLPLDQTYTYATAAAGINAYVIDTGIRASHRDFGGRVRQGRDTVDNTTTTPATATGTARTWPAPLAARPMAWPRA